MRKSPHGLQHPRSSVVPYIRVHLWFHMREASFVKREAAVKRRGERVKRTQFAAGADSPRWHRAPRHRRNSLYKKELCLMLCVLCGSVVERRAGVSKATDSTALPSSGLRKLLLQKTLEPDRRGACSPRPGSCVGKRRPAGRDRPARRGASPPRSRCSVRL